LSPVARATHGKEVFTMYCYANIGIPRNPANPFYGQTNCDSNPNGCNPLGTDFVDYGLGAQPEPGTRWNAVYGRKHPGTSSSSDGLFKAPSLRNTDMRPYPGFIKSFMHNGVFKSLEEVVHFYNKRNIATNSAGAEVAFDLTVGPPAGFTAIFPPPEVFDNVQNIAGLTPDETAQLPPPPDGDDGPPVALNGQVGNLQLTAQEEADIVAFLKTLTDGYTRTNR
jgi:cytochrome c peroxidase